MLLLSLSSSKTCTKLITTACQLRVATFAGANILSLATSKGVKNLNLFVISILLLKHFTKITISTCFTPAAVKLLAKKSYLY